MTVDHISQGRLELGIGAAGRPLDHTMTGSEVWGAPERTQRFRESVEIVDRVLRQRVTTYAGRWYRTGEAVMNPAPIQQPRPPLTLAAHGPATMKIAARWAVTRTRSSAPC
jgi:alkanesulfonate monooxygenase SsuD/methylene tetrahydromethanopterin reductase-like flavin-dependent oxidoreductase (luciferase family)